MAKHRLTHSWTDRAFEFTLEQVRS